MNDLIWIGNTLYPRWFVFGAIGLMICSPFIIGGLIMFIRKFVNTVRSLRQ